MTQSSPNNKNAILAVDDDTRILAFYRHVCLKIGYRLLMACDGADGLAAFQRHQEEIALVISDRHMPDMDGFLLWSALRKLNPDIKFLMVSGSLSDAEIQLLLSPGVVGCLRKPCSLQTLLSAVNQALALHQPSFRFPTYVSSAGGGNI